MNILCLGFVPSKEFKTTLASHAFTLETKKALAPPAKDSNWDLILVQTSKKTDLKFIDSLRQKHPESWFSLIVDKSTLADTDFYNLLLTSEAKNAVWLSHEWEALFWFSLQDILSQKEKHQRLLSLEQEVKHLRTKSQTITKRSEDLISQFEKDVTLAENIQRALRPRASPRIPGINLSVKYLPAAGLGGDYYDIFEFGDKKRFGLLLADSKTHGMAATLLTVLLKLRLEEMKDRFPDSKSFMSYLNQEIRTVYTKELSSLSLLYGILDRTNLTFQYTSAGNLSPFLWRQGNAAPLPALSNPPVGGMEHFDYREHTISLKPGDLLIFHTDGLEAPLALQGNKSFDQIVNILKKKDPSPDPLDVQNEFMALIDQYISKKELKDDLTLIHLAVDSRVMYMAKAE